jgi:ferrochelatase
VDKIWPYYGHPAFAECFTEAAAAALDSLPASVRDQADLVFTAHSIPDSMAERSGRPAISQQQSPAGGAYPAQLAEVAGVVAGRIGTRRPWRLAYTSRSGPPTQPWLVPDVNDLLEELAAAGSRAVAVVPVGFVSDHMEVRFDLDVEAAQTAARLGLPFARARTAGVSVPFVSMITDLVRQWQARPPEVVPGTDGAAPGFCGSARCCAQAPAAAP